MRQKLRIHVEPDHAPAAADAFAQQAGDPARTTPDVETRPALRHADQVEHGARVGRHRGRLRMKALDLAGAAFDRVVAGKLA